MTMENAAVDIERLMKLMVEKNASDLHLSVNCRPLLRVDGDIITLEEEPVTDKDALLAGLNKITPPANKKEFESHQDTDFAYEIPGVSRYRINIFRNRRGVSAAIRSIPSAIRIPGDLGVPQEVVDLCNIPKGLVLITGPTGSGKSTTLAALIDHINETQQRHIITIEDPIEFVHPNKKSLVSQRELHKHTGSFKRALRAAFREDPDVILVGEMRDLETIATAIEMAVTGHLVFGTVHTASAIVTPDRIIEQFPAGQQSQVRSMIADSLLAVISQTLCKKIDGGRVAAFEVLFITIGVSYLIREGKTFQIPSLMQTGKKLGMRTMNASLAELVEHHIITSGEAIAKAVDKAHLEKTLWEKNLLLTDPGADTDHIPGANILKERPRL